MAKFRVATDNKDEKRFIFYCPACEVCHWVRERGPSPCWQVTGIEEDKPTVRPSIRVRVDDDNNCHFFVENGKIKYLKDCTHRLKGQTVDILGLVKVPPEDGTE